MVRDSAGPGGWFVETVATAYLGTRNFDDPVFGEVDLVRHVTADFPPTWISGGNADPLTAQGLAFAARLEALGVAVTPVFYALDHEPRLNHEYQFDLALAEARAAMESSVAFLDSVTG